MLNIARHLAHDSMCCIGVKCEVVHDCLRGAYRIDEPGFGDKLEGCIFSANKITNDISSVTTIVHGAFDVHALFKRRERKLPGSHCHLDSERFAPNWLAAQWARIVKKTLHTVWVVHMTAVKAHPPFRRGSKAFETHATRIHGVMREVPLQDWYFLHCTATVHCQRAP